MFAKGTIIKCRRSAIKICMQFSLLPSRSRFSWEGHEGFAALAPISQSRNCESMQSG